MEPAAGSVVGGKYRLDRPLARGGMGAVWAGYHLCLDVPIAVKFMSAASDRSLRVRFEREARAAASLRSPHVVQVLDYDATGEVPFIVMELLEGQDLGQRLSERGRLPLDEVLVVVKALAAGLKLAHEAGIVHRDLKPGNIFIARIGSEEIVKILDFGVAKDTTLDASDTQTTTGVVVGSPAYMSPEQARGGNVDARSDLWSLAVVIFQALTGRRPFEGKNLGDVLVRICSDSLPVATAVRPELPAAIDAFFDRAFCRSPDGRFQDARALSHALLRVVDPSVPPKAEELAPRVDVTGAIVVPITLAATSPTIDADLVATVKARTVDLAPTIEARRRARLEPPFSAVDPPLATISGTALPTRRKSDRRGLLWGALGALAVGAVWIVSQSAIVRTPQQSGPSLGGIISIGPEASEQASQPRPAESLLSVAVEPSAVVSVSSAPLASSSASAAPTPVARQPLRRPAGAATVDPKFGLPGGRTQ